MGLSKRNKILNKVSRCLRKYQASVLAVEEISELITEISIALAGGKNYDDICEEIADVRIMTSLVMSTFRITNSDIKKARKKKEESFWKYTKIHNDKFNLESCIYELSNFQKTICKRSRGRKNKKDIINAIVGVELSIEYITSKKYISEEECEKWELKKLRRMQKRIRKHQIV